MKTILMLILMFFSYSFIGWLMEVILSIYQHHKFINRGFLIGPMCPIYGFGGVIIFLLLTRYREDPIVLYCMSIIICSILEYSTSYVLEKIFKHRWWDYSEKKYNINGRICLETMIPFGFGAIAMIYVVNPFLIRVFDLIPLLPMKIICGVLVVTAFIDMCLSLNIIANLKNLVTVKADNTEEISEKVKETINGKLLYKRLIDSFPDIKSVFKKFTDKLKIKK